MMELKNRTAPPPPGEILFADDEEAQRHFFSRICRDLDLPCSCASTGAECLALANKSAFRLVFVDLYMPESDLQILLPRLRDLQPNATIIVISVEDNETTMQRTFQLGAHAYLTKPLALPTLRNLLLCPVSPLST